MWKIVRRGREPSYLLKIPGSVVDTEFAKKALEAEARKARRGAGLGGLCVVAGSVVGLLDKWGHISWQITWPNGGSVITGATQGVILFLVGLLIVFVTNFKVVVVPDANSRGMGPIK